MLGASAFADKSTLIQYFRNLKRQSGVYIGRTLLDSFYQQLNELIDRDTALEIRTIYSRADLWEKRQLIEIMKKVLHEEEIRPWLKNIKKTESKELFLQEVISPTKKK
ncbi:hypothetical protein [Breznakia sp. PFB2-30]|uniref:hypothetical protein n=1 Tax=Breznakia sp. PFB2-30 TaxID=2940526 RepID=UPI002475856A|nr:hypothetical protein [Breznakia sp. PFB2-30]